MPFPLAPDLWGLGKGQLNTPNNYHNRGKVILSPFPLPFGLRLCGYNRRNGIMKSKITTPITLRGRKFTASSIDAIKSCVKEYRKFGRTRISREVCKRLNWKQPNGWLKDRACRDALVQLEKMGAIKLPEPKVKRKTKKENNIQECSVAKIEGTSDGYCRPTP